MKGVAATIDRIVGAASDTATAEGLAGLTVGKVADRAGVSTALVHYHFDTKQRLLAATAERLGQARAERREKAITVGRSLAVLDALWSVVEADVASGAERAWLELQAVARTDEAIRLALSLSRTGHRDRLAARLTVLLRELGSASVVGVEELALAFTALLDGLAAALTAGEDPAAVRAAYDAFWLAMIAAGQNPGGRRR